MLCTDAHLMPITEAKAISFSKLSAATAHCRIFGGEAGIGKRRDGEVRGVTKNRGSRLLVYDGAVKILKVKREAGQNDGGRLC